MATRNPANEIEFGKFNYGATMTSYTVTAAADVSAEVNPGEEMEAILESIAQRGTIIGLSAHSTGGTVFTVVVEGSSWADAAAVQTALQALALATAGAMTVA
jgi:hypothetical protein|tara:strand:- start:3804 stop:4109 length:306 start_codon:yes stop_codon:yes gene_type:complete